MSRFLSFACVSLLVVSAGCKNKGLPGEAGKVSNVVATAPTTTPQPDLLARPQTPPPEFVTHLQAGRKLESAKQWAQAVTELEAALRLMPDEPRALNDLGWAAFQAGDLEKAKKANERALAGGVTPQQKGAALYNMGRVAEAEKDFKAAADFYGRSVQLRPNTEVQRRLEGLTKPDAPLAARGPFSSMEAMCPELKKTESRLDFDDEWADHSDPYTFEFECNKDELKRIKSGLPPPLSEVVVFLSSALATNHPGRNHCHQGCWTQLFLNVAVRVGKQWYLLADVEHGLAFTEEGLQVLEAAVKPVGPAAAKLLVLRLNVDTSLSNMFSSSHQSITLIGAGPSGRPSALPPVKTKSTDGVYPYGDDANKIEVSESRREFRFEDGTLVVYRQTDTETTEGKRTQKKKKVTELNERYKLAFP